MRVVVDTSVWSGALRRKSPDPAMRESLGELVREGRVVMLGPIRQEILSGIREKKQFQLLRKRLAAFPDFALHAGHYEKAAECFNRCRGKGVQGSHVDFLICAVCLIENFSLYSADKDFMLYARYLDLTLFLAPDSNP